jgi:hypothetical protein
MSASNGVALDLKSTLAKYSQPLDQPVEAEALLTRWKHGGDDGG